MAFTPPSLTTIAICYNRSYLQHGGTSSFLPLVLVLATGFLPVSNSGPQLSQPVQPCRTSSPVSIVRKYAQKKHESVRHNQSCQIISYLPGRSATQTVTDAELRGATHPGFGSRQHSSNQDCKVMSLSAATELGEIYDRLDRREVSFKMHHGNHNSSMRARTGFLRKSTVRRSKRHLKR